MQFTLSCLMYVFDVDSIFRVCKVCGMFRLPSFANGCHYDGVVSEGRGMFQQPSFQGTYCLVENHDSVERLRGELKTMSFLEAMYWHSDPTPCFPMRLRFSPTTQTNRPFTPDESVSR